MNGKLKELIQMTVLIFTLSSNAYATVDEKLEYYLADENLESAVAKLFVVGYPGDIYNYTKCDSCSYLLNDLQVGGIILNQFNAPPNDLIREDKQVAFNKISSLIKDIRIRVRKDKKTALRIDPTIMVDFESYRYSSIKYPLTPPPSALAIASTGDANYSYYAGRLSGYQLRQIGVDAILGPVLDLNLILQQGSPNSTIRDRAYSDNRNIVFKHASAFIDGVKESNIQLFAKHFPSYSSIDHNPHSSASTHVGSNSFLHEELKIFEELSTSVDGIMTSHLNLGVENSYLPFTFSQEQMNKYLINNAEISSDAIFITDDLSNMAAVKEYRSINKKSYSDIAYDAFISGHDLLLFSGYESKSEFGKKELTNAIKYIAKKATNIDSVKNKLKKSLKKIFELQERKQAREEVIDFDYEATEQFSNSDFKNTDDYFKSTFKNGVISIKNKPLPNLSELSSDHKFILVTEKSLLKTYSDFSEQGSRYTVESKPDYIDIEKYALYLRVLLEEYDFVYLTIDNLDDANAVDYIRIHLPKLLEKLIILLHANPDNLSNLVINKATYIISNFSYNPIAYEIDLDFILHGSVPKSIDKLPISLNGKSFHDSANVKVKPHDKSDNPIIFYGTEKERELVIENKLLKLELNDIKGNKQTTLSIVRFYLNLLFAIIGLLLFLSPLFKKINITEDNITILVMIKNLAHKLLWPLLVLYVGIFLILLFSFFYDDSASFLHAAKQLINLFN
jgi:beta-glucosidase-like glycosyl hydrolase